MALLLLNKTSIKKNLLLQMRLFKGMFYSNAEPFQPVASLKNNHASK
jgi:hypothetical protein